MGQTSYFAEQRVSEAIKHGKAFTEDVTDGLIKRAQALDANDKTEIENLIDAMNGIINTNDYSYVLNPYHSTNPKLIQFPAKLRNYNIITPIWQRYLGEMIKARKPIKVGVNNPDSLNRFKQDLQAKTDAILRDKLAKSLNRHMGTDNPESQKEVDLGTVVSDYTDNWNDQRAIFGQEAINRLDKELDLEYKYWEAYLDWVSLGEFYTYKDVIKDDIFEEVVSPIEYYPIGNADFVEDDDAGVRIFRLSLSEIIEKFGHRLSKSDYKTIEEMIIQAVPNTPINVPGTFKIKADENMDSFNVKSAAQAVENFTNNNHEADVAHCVFKGQRRIQILTYRNELDKLITKEISDDYELDKAAGDVALEYTWVNRVYESYRFGPEGGAIYIPVNEILVQRQDLNNSSKVKLPYGGKKFLFTNVFNHSIIKALLPYQVLYNIIHRYREMAIAKNKGKLLVIPKGILANDDEITQEESIFYIKSDGLVVVDETEDNFANAINGLKGVDLSDSSYIISLGGILQEIKEEAWDEVSMNRQRFGQSYASDGKATTEQAVFRASIGSLPINEVFNKAIEKEYEALLDYSKMAWIEEDGTKNKGAYINSENRLAYFKVNGREHLETNYGVFVSNSFEEQKKTEMYEQLVFAIGQQGNMEVAVQGIEAGNNSKLRKIIKDWRKAEDAKLEQQQQAEQKQQEAQAQAQQAVIDREEAQAQAERDNKTQLQTIKSETDILIKDMEISAKGLDNDSAEAIARDKDSTTERVTNINATVSKYIANLQARTKAKVDSSKK